MCTPLKTNMESENNLLFQGFLFKFHVSFRGEGSIYNPSTATLWPPLRSFCGMFLPAALIVGRVKSIHMTWFDWKKKQVTCAIVQQTYGYIWVFPKIVVPPNHPNLIGCSIINHPFSGTPIFGKHPYVVHFPSNCNKNTPL